MSILRQVSKRLHRLSPAQLEAFRKKLEHGQPDWTTDDYVSLYLETPDLRERMCAYLSISTEPRRDCVAILIGAVVGIAGIIVSVVLAKT